MVDAIQTDKEILATVLMESPAEISMLLESGKVQIIEQIADQVLLIRTRESFIPTLNKSHVWSLVPYESPASRGPCPYTTKGYYIVGIPDTVFSSVIHESKSMNVKFIERLSTKGYLALLEPQQISFLWNKTYITNIEPYVTPLRYKDLLNSIQNHERIKITVRQPSEMAQVQAVVAKYATESVNGGDRTMRVVFKDESGMQCLEEIAKLGCADFIEHYAPAKPL